MTLVARNFKLVLVLIPSFVAMGFCSFFFLFQVEMLKVHLR